MGVQGLLRSLRAVTVQRHIRDYKGLTVAIDTYAWLHRIIKGKCCSQLFNFHISNRFIVEILNRIQTFKQFGITVIMVFDGAPLPGKVEQQKARKARRQQCQNEAMQLLNQGKNEQGNKKLIESVDITPEIAYRLIQTLKKKNVAYIVAPYEADAELAYLSRTGIADVIITEDSDLLAYGAKKVLYKYDINTCIGQEIQLENIKKNQDPSLRYFSHCMFLSACIMSGCDYVSTIPGIGHKTAFKLVSSNGTGGRAIQQARRIKMVPSVYEDNFVKAYLIYRFQYVYCPKQKKCVMVNDFEGQMRKGKPIAKNSWGQECFDQYIFEQVKSGRFKFVDFIGELPQEEEAQGIGQGYIHPMTKQPYSCSNESNTQIINLIRSKTRIKKSMIPANTIDNYFKPPDKFDIKHTQLTKKITNTNIELQPVDDENSKSNIEPSAKPKLLVCNTNTKKNFYKDLQQLLEPVFDEEWFNIFGGIATPT